MIASKPSTLRKHFQHSQKMSNCKRLEYYLTHSFRPLVEAVNLDEVHDLFGATASGWLARALERLSALEEQGGIRVARDESWAGAAVTSTLNIERMVGEK